MCERKGETLASSYSAPATLVWHWEVPISANGRPSELRLSSGARRDAHIMIDRKKSRSRVPKEPKDL